VAISVSWCCGLDGRQYADSDSLIRLWVRYCLYDKSTLAGYELGRKRADLIFGREFYRSYELDTNPRKSRQ